MSKQKILKNNQHFGASFSRQIVQEIDKVRGDTNRSLWLQRAAEMELARQKNEQKEKEENRNYENEK
jgi:metal-responsive CopG/Arc/MetJ family transcriptional regulator